MFYMRYIVVLALGCLYLTTPVQAEQERPATVRTAKVESGTAAATADFTGTLYFDRISRVSSEEASRIVRINFREGGRVKKGDILARLDTRILQQELVLEKARLEQVGIQLEKAAINLERQTLLFKNNATPESVYDEQRFAHEELQQEQVVLSRRVDILNIRLSKHIVRAPFDGIILEKLAALGEWAVPGTPLCVLAATDAIYIQVPVAETLLPYIPIGGTLPVILHASGRELTGVMEGIRPRADSRTKNISLKIKLDYAGQVAENMAATVTVPVSARKSVLMMPRDALVRNQGQDMVYIVENGKAAIRPVTLVYAREERIGVAAPGITPGMAVVIQGNERLRPGQAVAVQPGE